jgi:hypothetical protein
MAEKFGVTGELYWGTTFPGPFYQPDRNPWNDAMSWNPDGTPFGNGDGLLFYPPSRSIPITSTLHPFSSLRLEVIREGVEDAEYFWFLKRALREGLATRGPLDSAVREAYDAYQAVVGMTTTSTVFTRDPEQLYRVRDRVGAAIEALTDGTPFFAKQPLRKGVSPGKLVTFRTEAIGWPMPQYQWFFNGSPIPNATNSSLTLTNVLPSDNGHYSVRATNVHGIVVSDAAALAVVDYSVPAPPFIVEDPESQTVYPGANAVLAVTVASSEPVSYTWYKDGARVPSGTNSVLWFTNLTETARGWYSVAVTNIMGGTVSVPAALSFPVPPDLKVTAGKDGSILLSYFAFNRPTRVLVTTDLGQWEELARVLPSKEEIRVKDPVWVGTPAKFYRVEVE